MRCGEESLYVEVGSSVSTALIAAASAFLVACIAGGFSILGLLISKEQQVSGFRQSWIDQLRADLATLVAHAYQIHAFLLRPDSWNYGEFWTATREDYLELNKASVRIKLRLNRQEIESVAILENMTRLELMFADFASDPKTASLDKINNIIDALETGAPPLLKKEWQRVKKGEFIYRVAKWVAVIAFIVTAILAFVLFWEIHASASANIRPSDLFQHWRF